VAVPPLTVDDAVMVEVSEIVCCELLTFAVLASTETAVAIAGASSTRTTSSFAPLELSLSYAPHVFRPLEGSPSSTNMSVPLDAMPFTPASFPAPRKVEYTSPLVVNFVMNATSLAQEPGQPGNALRSGVPAGFPDMGKLVVVARPETANCPPVPSAMPLMLADPSDPLTIAEGDAVVPFR